jgi:hypothetical protein
MLIFRDGACVPLERRNFSENGSTDDVWVADAQWAGPVPRRAEEVQR